MGFPTLGTQRLPVQTHGDLYGRLPKCRAADGQGLGVPLMIQPIAPHHARLGHWDMEEPPLQKGRHGQGHPLGRGRPRLGVLLPGAIGEGDAVTIPGHQTRVFDGATTQIPCQIRDHTGSVPIALPHVHIPRGLLGMAEPMEEIEKLLGTHGLWQPQHVPGKSPPEGAEPLAPQHRHDRACREQKPVAHGLPGSVWSQPPAGDETMEMGMQHEGLTPGVQRREDARLRASVLRSR